jgi:sRNA-binding protein
LDSKFRIPLKNDIVDDLNNAGFPVAKEILVSSIEWYKSHWAYQYQLKAGAVRIDLNGKAVSTVTETEAMNAQKRIQEQKARQRLNPVAVLNSLHESGHIPDDQIKKLDIPRNSTYVSSPIKTIEDKKGATHHNAVRCAASELDKIYEALDTADRMLRKETNDLRREMAIGALRAVIKETQKIIATLSDTEE